MHLSADRPVKAVHALHVSQITHHTLSSSARVREILKYIGSLLFKFDLVVWLHLQLLKVTSIGWQKKSIFLSKSLLWLNEPMLQLLFLCLNLKLCCQNKFNCQIVIPWNGLSRRRNARIKNNSLTYIKITKQRTFL